jgi:hypothetical protein
MTTLGNGRGDPDGAVAAIGKHVENSRMVFLGHMRRDRAGADQGAKTVRT